MKIICPFPYLHNFAYLFYTQMNSFGFPHPFSFPPAFDVPGRSGSAWKNDQFFWSLFLWKKWVLLRRPQGWAWPSLPEFTALFHGLGSAAWRRSWSLRSVPSYGEWRGVGRLVRRVSSRQVVGPPCRRVFPRGLSCCHSG